jgi:hypothetical protein
MRLEKVELYYRQQQNVGNFETCINRSKGKYIHLLHGDDKIDFGFYNEIETLFHNFPKLGLLLLILNILMARINLVASKTKKFLILR